MFGSSRARRAARTAVVGVAAGLSLALAIEAPAYADVIKGNANNNTLRGTAGADTIYGYGGNDELYGRDGGDELRGGGGADDLYGGYGKDDLYGGTGNDKLVGGIGTAGDRLFGGSGADILSGGKGPDVIKGDGGHDKLRGNEGDDTIRARDGIRDRITCGAGKDTAVVNAGDLITDTSATRRRGSCEQIRLVNPWRMPLKRTEMAEGRSGLDDPHWSSTPAIDLQLKDGLSGIRVFAVRGGHVTIAGWGVPDWCGMGVEIAGIGGGRYLYCHMRSVAVKAGWGVTSGTVLGRTGNTGNSRGEHLHFAVISGNRGFVCPQKMLLAIWDGRPVPLPRDLPATGCTSG